MSGQYILDADGNPVPEPDLLTWGLWMETADRIVRHDRFDHPFPPTEDQICRYTSPVLRRSGELGHAVESMDLRILVSTVFLGLDHRYGDGPPLLFESMIFGGPLSGEQRRYSTKAEALAGHEALCGLVRMEIAAHLP